jgi:hypothetical protein
MYRLIVILEWIFGSAFVFLFFWVAVFEMRLFRAEAGMGLLLLSVILSFLFILGAITATNQVTVSKQDIANARRKTSFPFTREPPPGRDLLLIGGTFGIPGLLLLFSERSAFCGDSSRLYCKLIRAVAMPLGISNIDTAINLVLVLIGIFFGLWGFWLNRSARAQQSLGADQA